LGKNITKKGKRGSEKNETLPLSSPFLTTFPHEENVTPHGTPLHIIGIQPNKKS